MAWWDGLLGGGGGSDLDIYGDLFTEKQKAALAQRSAGEGLLKLAGAFGAAAQPSRMPTSFLGTLGQAAGAMAGSGDEAAKTALEAMKTGEAVKASKQKRDLIAKATPIVQALIAAGIDPNSPLGRQALATAGVPAGAAPAAVPSAPAAAPGMTTSATAADAAIPAPGYTTAAPPGAQRVYDGPVPPADPAAVPPGLGAAGAPPLNALGMPASPAYTRYGLPARPGAGQQPPPAPASSSFAPPANYPGATPGGQAPAGQQGGVVIDGRWYPSTRAWNLESDKRMDDANKRALGQSAGLLPPPPGAPPGQVPGIGLLAAGGGAPPPFSGGGPPGAPDLSNFTAADAGGGGDDGGNWQRDKPLIRKLESGNRNIEQGIVPPGGGYNPSVGRVTGPSSASGYYQMIDSTWRNAAAKVGIDTNKYPRAVDAPEELQDKAAEALYREQGLNPWAPYNKPLAAATGYRGGGGGTRMAGAPDLSNMAGDAGGGGDDAAPGGGYIPGLGITPQGLGALNALLEMGGVDSPFKSVLDTYYKSPGYLGEAATAETTARKKVEQQFDPIIEAQKTQARLRAEIELKPQLEVAVGRAMSPVLKDREQAKAEIDRVTEQMRQAGVAGTSVKDVTVADDSGRPIATKMTELEFAIRQKNIAERRANGDTTVRPGDIVGTPVLSPEETAAQTQRGKTGQEMTTVQVWTPNGTVSQPMTNLEAAARRKLASERGPGGPPQIGDIVDAPALTEPEKKIAGALGEDFVTLRRQAQAASSTISSTHDLRAKLDSGIFTGLDANWNLFAAKMGEALGWTGLSNPEKVKNTEVYISGIGKEVLAMVKDLRPASNVDLQFAERMAGGANMSAGAIRELLDMRERYARLAVERHNEEARGMNPGAFTGFRREIPMPPPYQQKSGTTPGGLRWKE